MFHRYKKKNGPPKLMLESVMRTIFTAGNASRCEGIVLAWRSVCLASCSFGVELRSYQAFYVHILQRETCM